MVSESLTLACSQRQGFGVLFLEASRHVTQQHHPLDT